MSRVRIGCSGFSYPDWRGIFYPEKLPHREWFSYYCSVFQTVELNVTFYRLPREAAFDRWQRESPTDFAFCLKGSRFVTHLKRLLEPREPVDLFFRNSLRLGEKLKAVLWQFPPSFKASPARLKRFLMILDAYPVRNTLEFRNETWMDEKIFDLCRDHNVSLCMADWPPFLDDLPVTADFVYIRRHGETGSYDRKYSRTELKRDAQLIAHHADAGRDVFIYFNNDYAGYAPQNARDLFGLIRR